MERVRHCARQTIRSNAAAAILIYMAGLFLLPPERVDLIGLIRLGERYLPLAGIFWFLAAGRPEEECGAADIVYLTGRFFPGYYLARLAFLTASAGLMMLLYLGMISGISGNPDIGVGELLMICQGVFAGQLFLGLMSMEIAAWTKQRRIGLIAGLLWFLADTQTNGSLMGAFTLLGYETGRPWTKGCLWGACAGLAILSVMRMRRRVRGRG